MYAHLISMNLHEDAVNFVPRIEERGKLFYNGYECKNDPQHKQRQTGL